MRIRVLLRLWRGKPAVTRGGGGEKQLRRRRDNSRRAASRRQRTRAVSSLFFFFFLSFLSTETGVGGCRPAGWAAGVGPSSSSSAASEIRDLISCVISRPSPSSRLPPVLDSRDSGLLRGPRNPPPPTLVLPSKPGPEQDFSNGTGYEPFFMAQPYRFLASMVRDGSKKFQCKNILWLM